MVYSFMARGLWGARIEVEGEVRRGIPGMDIVGMGDGAVKEARERIRAAFRATGVAIPGKKMTINLAPAGIRKEGAAFDLAMALVLMDHIIEPEEGRPLPRGDINIMAVGELGLGGEVRSVRGVLPAALQAQESGIDLLIVPREALHEARPFTRGRVAAVSSLPEAWHYRMNPPAAPWGNELFSSGAGQYTEAHGRDLLDFADVLGQEKVKRAAQVSAAGGHNLLLFGPPGCGKTMSALRIPFLLPALEEDEILEVSRLWSLAGKLTHREGLIHQPPFRNPHHSASHQGIIGGGKGGVPGEVSLAHHGILFLDEASQFRQDTLQSLREPLEGGQVSLVRAGERRQFPADFQLVMAVNPCPCGQLGSERGICSCSASEIHRYWRRLGGPLLDRIDMRVPVEPVPLKVLMEGGGLDSHSLREGVLIARSQQRKRFQELDVYTGEQGGIRKNSRIPPALLSRVCPLRGEARKNYQKTVSYLHLSTRACHSVLRLSRTIADLAGRADIQSQDILEAAQYRRYGDGDYYWGP